MDLENKIKTLENNKKIIDELLQDLYFEKMLKDNKYLFNLREILFCDNEKYNKIFEKNIPDHVTKIKDIYLLKARRNNNEYYIYQPIKKVLEHFQQKDLYYYSKNVISDILKNDIPVLIPDSKNVSNFYKKMESSNKILSFYVEKEYYVDLYHAKLPVYVNEKNKKEDLLLYYDTYDDSEYINFAIPDNYIQGTYICFI
jgi:hypothetical protein